MNVARKEIEKYDKHRESNGFSSTEEMAEAYAKALTYAIFTEHDYLWAYEETAKAKKYIEEAVLSASGHTFWELEDYALKNEIQSSLIYWYYQLCLLRSFWSLEDFIFYMEQGRMQGKRFYLPRINPLHTLIKDFEDLFNHEIKFLGISMPPRSGKSTLCIFALAWLAMKRPNTNSAMCGHSGVLADGFYDELMNFFTSPEYRFADMYSFWNPNKTLLQDKSAEYRTINLDAPDRMNTLTCRGIDGSWTGAINISSQGVLYVDDLVRDREHSLSPTRMENTWQEYLNKVHDRLNPYCPKNAKDEREIFLRDDLFPEPPELMVGTLWNVYDPLYRYEQKYADDPLYRFRKIPALNENDESNFEYYPTEYFLNQRELLSEADFAAKFQQSPFVREGLLYQPSELNYFNGECPEGKTIAVLDPAVGGGDFLSMLVIRVVGKKNYIIDWLYSNETKGKTIPAICVKIMFHKVTELHYERNGIGRAFEEDVTKALHERGHYSCKAMPFNAPEGMSKEDKILGYSDWVKTNLWFISEEAKSTTYSRSQDYTKALNDMFIYTTVGKNKHDDSVDNLAQAARVFEKQSNGVVDVILNPFGGGSWR